MRNVGAGGDEAHSQVGGQQHLLQQQGGTEVQRRAQRVSVDSPLTGTRSAAGPLLLASHSTSCALTSVYAACPADLCSLCCFAPSLLDAAAESKFGSRLLPRIVEDSSSATDRLGTRTAERVDSDCSSARERGCCDALVLRRAEEGVAAILSNIAAEAVVHACEHACAHKHCTACYSTHVCIVSNVLGVHSMCVGCDRDEQSERSWQGRGEIS